MKALSWQSLIVLTILGAFLLSYLFFSFKRAIQIGLGVVIFWFAWTLGLSVFFVGYSLSGPLARAQLFLILVMGLSGFFLIYSFKKWKDRNKKLLEENIMLRNEMEKLKKNFNVPEPSQKVKPQRTIRGSKEHREEFKKQLKGAKDRVLILSGWVTPYGYDHNIQNLLKKSVTKKVEIFIGWGYKTKAEEINKNYALTKTEKKLIDWGKKHREFVTIAHFKNHSKLLIVDSTCFIGSFNWLSNAFSENDELSAVIENKEFVENLWSSVSKDVKKYSDFGEVAVFSQNLRKN